MEKVKIDFFGIERLIKRHYDNMIKLLDDYEEYEEDIKQYCKDIAYLYTLKDGIEIITMAEYVRLLKRIDELADWDYEICDYGTSIVLR